MSKTMKEAERLKWQIDEIAPTQLTNALNRFVDIIERAAPQIMPDLSEMLEDEFGTPMRETGADTCKRKVFFQAFGMITYISDCGHEYIVKELSTINLCPGCGKPIKEIADGPA